MLPEFFEAGLGAGVLLTGCSRREKVKQNSRRAYSNNPELASSLGVLRQDAAKVGRLLIAEEPPLAKRPDCSYLAFNGDVDAL